MILKDAFGLATKRRRIQVASARGLGMVTGQKLCEACAFLWQFTAGFRM